MFTPRSGSSTLTARTKLPNSPSSGENHVWITGTNTKCLCISTPTLIVSSIGMAIVPRGLAGPTGSVALYAIWPSPNNVDYWTSAFVITSMGSTSTSSRDTTVKKPSSLANRTIVPSGALATPRATVKNPYGPKRPNPRNRYQDMDSVCRRKWQMFEL